MNYFLKGKRSLYFKFFAVFILLFSSFLPSFTYGVAYAEANYEDSVNGDENGSTRNEREGREYDRANIDKRVTWSGENPGEYFIDLTVEGKLHLRKKRRISCLFMTTRIVWPLIIELVLQEKLP